MVKGRYIEYNVKTGETKVGEREYVEEEVVMEEEKVNIKDLNKLIKYAKEKGLI